MSTLAPAVPGSARRPLRTGILVAAYLRRDWAMAVSYRMAFALQWFQALWGIVLVYFLSRFLGHALVHASPDLRQGYFAYAAIGVSLLAVLQVALVTFASKLRQDQQTGTFETVIASPTPPWLMVLASSSYDLIQSAISGILTILLAMGLFGLRLHGSPASYGLALLILVASLGVFAGFGILYAAFVVVFKRGDMIMSLFTAVMGLGGGVFFPASVLPPGIRPLAQAFPLTQASNLLRDTLLFHKLPLGQVGELCATAVVLLPPSLWLFGRAVRRARKVGTLGQY